MRSVLVVLLLFASCFALSDELGFLKDLHPRIIKAAPPADGWLYSKIYVYPASQAGQVRRAIDARLKSRCFRADLGGPMREAFDKQGIATPPITSITYIRLKKKHVVWRLNYSLPVSGNNFEAPVEGVKVKGGELFVAVDRIMIRKSPQGHRAVKPGA